MEDLAKEDGSHLHTHKHIYPRKGEYLAAPHTHHCLKTLRPCDIPSKIIVQLCWIRDSRERIVIINLV
jgi:hypothetical protein